MRIPGQATALQTLSTEEKRRAIRPVPEQQAELELKTYYEQVRRTFGFMPNYFLTQGRIPELVDAQLRIREVIMKDGALSAAIKGQIALVVSGINTSSYCVAIHLELLRPLGIEKPLGRILATDYGRAPVGDAVQALFRFADKLTRKESDICQADIDAVFAAGWDQAALFETVLVVSLMNFANRFAMGCGLMADF